MKRDCWPKFWQNLYFLSRFTGLETGGEIDTLHIGQQHHLRNQSQDDKTESCLPQTDKHPSSGQNSGDPHYLRTIYTVSTQYLHMTIHCINTAIVSTEYIHSIYRVYIIHSIYRLYTQYSIYKVSTDYLHRIYSVSAHRQPPVEDGVLVYGGDALRAPHQLVAALAGRQLGRGDHRGRGQLWSREW